MKFRCHPLGKYDFKLGRLDIGPFRWAFEARYYRRLDLYVFVIYFDVAFVNSALGAEKLASEYRFERIRFYKEVLNGELIEITVKTIKLNKTVHIIWLGKKYF